MKTKILALNLVFTAWVLLISSVSYSELLLFNSENEFRGCIECSRLEAESICNKFGDYGSKFSDISIWNKFGAGSKFEDDSPFSKFGNGLKVVDKEGKFYGWFSVSVTGDSKMRRYLKDLWDITNGNYSEMRDIFCDS